MANTPNTKAILYIERGGFTLYQNNNSAVSRFTFPPTAVHDLEVINSDELESQIKLFVGQNKIMPAHLLFIVGETAYFQKEFPPPTETTQIEGVENFINNVPFEHPGYRVYNVEKKSVVIATNSDLYGALERGFTGVGFMLTAVVPIYMVKSINKTLTVLNEESIKTLFKQFDSLKAYNFLYEDDSFFGETSSTENQNKKSPPTLFILLGIFGILLIVLALVYIQSQNTSVPTQTTSPTVQNSLPVDETPVASDSAFSEASESATLQESDVRIQVINGSGVVGPEEDIKNALTPLGFNNINATTTGTVTSATSIIVFTEKVPPSLRDKIIEATKEKIGDVSAQEGTNEQFEVVITISRKP